MMRFSGLFCMVAVVAVMAGCGQCGTKTTPAPDRQATASSGAVAAPKTVKKNVEPPKNYVRSRFGVFVIDTQTWKTVAATPASPDPDIERFVVSPDGGADTVPRMTITALHDYRVSLADMAKDPKKTLWKLIDRMRPDLAELKLSPAQLHEEYTGNPGDYATGRLVGIPRGEALVDVQLWVHFGNTSVVLIMGLAGKGDNQELLDHMAFIARSIKWMPGYAHDGALPLAGSGRTLRIPAVFAPVRGDAGGKAAQWFSMAGCEARKPFVIHLQPMKQVVAGSTAHQEDVGIWIATSRRSQTPPRASSPISMKSWFSDNLTRLRALFPDTPGITAAFDGDIWGLMRFDEGSRRQEDRIVDIARVVNGSATICLITETKGGGMLPGGYRELVQSLLPGEPVNPATMKGFK